MNQAMLIEALQTHVATKPDDIAVNLLNDETDIAATISYRELSTRARAMAFHLLQQCKPGDRALMLYENGPEFILAFMACLQAGIVAVPAYPPRRNQNSDRLRALVQDADCPVILSTEKLVSLFGDRMAEDSHLAKVKVIRTDVDIDTEQALPESFEFPKVARDDLAFLQYSSGSTGDPKGVMVTQGNISDNIQYMFEGMGHDANTVSVSWLPNFHDMGLISGILEPIYYGYPVYLMSPTQFLQRPLNWLKAISRYRATSTGAPNFAFDLCVERYRAEEVEGLDLSCLRTAYNGAEPIRAETLTQFTQCYAAHGFKHCAHLPCYGMAEVTLYATGTPVNDEPRVVYADKTAFEQNRIIDRACDQGIAKQNSEVKKTEENSTALVSAGVPMYDDQIQIVDTQTGIALADDCVGEIWLCVNAIAQGYLNKAELTEQCFHARLQDNAGNEIHDKGPYLRTGDLGFTRDGWLYVTGREKDLIILNGRNYYPQDIELEAFKSHPALADNNAAAFSIATNEGEKIVLLQEVRRTEVRKKAQFPAIIEAIRTQVAQHLALPLFDVVLLKPNSVQKTSSGKIQRRKNRQLYIDNQLTPLASFLQLTPSQTQAKPDSPTKLASSTKVDSAAKTKAKTTDKSTPEVAVPLNETLQPKDLAPTSVDSRHANNSVVTAPFKWVSQWLAAFIANKTGLAEAAIDSHTPFMAQGIDSATGVNMIVELGERLGISLPATLVYDYTSITELAEHVAQHYPVNNAVFSDVALGQLTETNTTSQHENALESDTRFDSELSDRDIAIIGFSNQFASATDNQEFWQGISQGKCFITVPSAARQQLTALPEAFAQAGYLDGVDQFDASFFGISATEVNHVDPQQRLLLEQSYLALRDAELAITEIAGSQTGVYIGQGAADYMTLLHLNNQSHSAYLGTGNSTAISANRLSYFYDLHGPSLSVDSACSASLVALSLAIDDLRQGKTNMALVGGVNLALNPQLTDALGSANMLAEDGRCKVFDAAADGYVRGEGAAVLLLKTARQAEEDQNTIKAIIKGIAVYQDGKSNGLTAPNGLAQQAVIKAALTDAKVSAEQVSYVEMHGTGTELGDPIEVNAALAVYQREGQPLALGAVKANVGHLEAAAGLAGLCKLINCLQQQKLPPQLHVKQLNPHVSWQDFNVTIPSALCDWQTQGPRIGALSSFGFGGTNVHVVVQQAPENPLASSSDSCTKSTPFLLALSAKKPEALQALLQQWIQQLSTSIDSAELADLCRRSHKIDTEFKYRIAVQGQDQAQLLAALHRKAQQLNTDASANNSAAKAEGMLATSMGSKGLHRVFLFTGQGAQYLAMGRQLYQTAGVFRETVDACLQQLQQVANVDLSSVWLNGDDETLLTQTQYAQPALFVIEYALANYWQALGVTPDVVLGHSVGEYAAACIAGVLSLPDALRVIAARGRLLQALPANGGMLAIETTVSAWLAAVKDTEFTELAIASDHGNVGCVVSGPATLLAKLPEFLQQQSWRFTALEVSHGFHSSLVEPAIAEFRQTLATVDWQLPQLPMISTLTGHRETHRLASADYWCEQLRECVQFAGAVDTLWNEALTQAPKAHVCFLEVGPKPILLGLIQQLKTDSTQAQSALYLPSLRENIADHTSVYQSLAQLFERGACVQWSAIDLDSPVLHAGQPLPTYPFQRQSYWFPIAKGNTMPAHQPAVNSTVVESSECLPETPVATSAETIEALREQQAQEVQNHVLQTFANALSCSPADIDPELAMLEVGADSLVISNVIRSIERRYGLDFTVRQIYEEVTTPQALTDYIVATLPEPTLPKAVELPSEHGAAINAASAEHHSHNHTRNDTHDKPTHSFSAGLAVDSDVVSQVLSQQLHIAGQVNNDSAATAISQVAQSQLQWLGQAQSLTNQPVAAQRTAQQVNAAAHVNSAVNPKAQPVTSTATAQGSISQRANPKSSSRSNAGALPGFKIKSKTRTGFTEQQNAALAKFSRAYIAKTTKSREQTIAYRPVLADSRASAGFRLSTKSMLYPIYAERAQGCKTWDIDGNEYLDITMGFGVNLFGHQPGFIVDAIQQQLQTTMQLGLQVELSGKVAQLLCELTGHERAAFCNSGTEAVMTALRLACTKTKRSKIVQFETAYHGHFDGTLGQVGMDGLHAEPTAPGVRAGSVADVIMLEYGSDAALDTIREHAHELAAVIVEPVQSRRPELQPKAFLQALRQITAEHGICFIVDEMITGFRADIGGAQAYFDIKADLATYGKIIGGGLPIGAVVGSAQYMDGIDGGQWQYEDDSYPEAATTLFAGTFNKHPLTMAAAHAVLTEIKQRGPQLQQSLSQKTAYLCDSLNAYFHDEGIPIEMVYFTSLFRFKFNANLDLLFFQLIHHGIYVWEGRNCFIADVHTEADIEQIIQGIKHSVQALVSMGFVSRKRLPAASELAQSANNLAERSYTASVADSSTNALPLNEAQQQLFALHQINKAGSRAYHLYGDITLTGSLQQETLTAAIKQTVARHSLLNTVISEDGCGFLPIETAAPQALVFNVGHIDFSALAAPERADALAAYYTDTTQDGFSLTDERLIRADIIQCDKSTWRLAITVHHIVADGLSVDVLINEIAQTYNALMVGDVAPLPEAFHVEDFTNAQQRYFASEQCQQDKQFWQATLNGQTPLQLPFGANKATTPEFAGASLSLSLSAAVCADFEQTARRLGCTPFMAFLGVYSLWLGQLSQQSSLLIGMPVSGRGLPLAATGDSQTDEHNETRFGEHFVGYCSHLMPLAIEMPKQGTVAQHFTAVRSLLLAALSHQNYPFSRIVNDIQRHKNHDGLPLIATIFNVDNVNSQLAFSGCDVAITTRPALSAYLPLNVNLTKSQGAWLLDVTWQSHLFSANEVESFLGYFEVLLREIASDFTQPVNLLPSAPNAEYLSQLNAANSTTTESSAETASAQDIQRHAVVGESQLVTPLNVEPTPRDSDPSVPALLLQQAKLNPNAVAVCDDVNQLSYWQLLTQATALAKQLQSMGATPNSMIAICQQRQVNMLVSMLAIQLSGAAYLPVDPHYPQARIDYVLQDAQVSIVLCDLSTQGQLEAFSEAAARSHTKQVWPIEQLLALTSGMFAAGDSADNSAQIIAEADTLVRAISPQQLAYVIYTSGSTGNPKGVMVEHQQLANFALGMQERLALAEGNWLASTSLSFDISILELLVPLTQGMQVTIAADQRLQASHSPTVATAADDLSLPPENDQIGFSLFYFASDLGEDEGRKYDLLFEGARFADAHGFEAVWTPERHFATFGGLYSNPTITSAALASVTQNIKIRAGSCVSPLHNAVRLAEDWSMIDNVSDGRVGVAFAPGWQHNDFVLNPDAFAQRHDLLKDNIATIQALWRGETVDLLNPHGDTISVLTKPRPIQAKLPIWLTIGGNPEAFRYAGQAGHNVLTHLLGQRLTDLAEKLVIYREAWKAAGHDGEGHVTLMIHTYIADDADTALTDVEAPFKQYLKDSLSLLQGTEAAQGIRVDELDDDALSVVLEGAFQRYSKTSALFGSVDDCLPLVQEINALGINELACLIDFGVDETKVKQALPKLNQLRRVANGLPAQQRDALALTPTAATSTINSAQAEPAPSHSLTEWMQRTAITHFQCTPSHMSALLADDDFVAQLPALNALLLGGEALPLSLLSAIKSAAPNLVVHNMYGPTETAIWSTSHTFNAADELPTQVSIGRAIRHTQVQIVDEQLQPLPVGEQGELLIAGAGVARGYWQRGALTAERFVHDASGTRWYRTGDIAMQLPNGELRCLGRIDQQVKIRGYRIELGEIEHALTALPDIEQAAVVAVTASSDRQMLVAQVVLASQTSVTENTQTSVTENTIAPYCKQALASALPSYMLPQHIQAVAKLPITPNGKIDRNQIAQEFTDPNPTATANRESHSQPISANIASDESPDNHVSHARSATKSHTANATSAETLKTSTKNSETDGEVGQLLKQLWAELLNKPMAQLNGDANFFTLGGDSILAIQLVARAKQVGLQIGANQLFKYQTIAALIPQIKQRVVSVVDQSAIVGEQPLLPIHQQFLRIDAGKHHHNQAVMLTAPTKLTTARLTRMLAAIVARHDALRLLFTQNQQEWTAAYHPLTSAELTGMVTAHAVVNSAEITAIAEQQQRALNIEKGPLLHGALFTLPTREQRLLLIVHHVAIDGVSWRILLHDLDTLWAQISQDQPLQLADKTHSYQHWGHLLTHYAHSSAVAAQLADWQAIMAVDGSLPITAIDAHSKANAKEACVASKTITLTEQTTQLLLRDAPAAYNSQVAEWLIAVFVMSVGQQWQLDALRIDLEGHGRELDSVNDALAATSHHDASLDISQTLGWFTSLFPVSISGLTASFADIMANTKQALRSIADKGLGFGAAKYLRENSPLATANNADILFNYLGQFDQSTGEHFQFSTESVGEMMADEQRLGWPLIVNAIVQNNQLSVDISYDRHRFSDADMDAFAQQLQRNLSTCATDSAAQALAIYSPADFPLAQVSSTEINQWQQQYAATPLVDIYPATRLQQGLLFYSSLDSSAYITQIMWRMSSVDIARLQQAWQVLVQRHAVFRTAFDRLATEQPLQLVMEKASLQWAHHDLTELSRAQQDAKFTELRLAEKAAGMQPEQAPLTRFVSADVGDNQIRILWSYHHALLDGWSVPILIEELGAIYAVLAEHPEFATIEANDWQKSVARISDIAQLPEVVPYKHYIEWLAQTDSKHALNYWQQLLHDIPVMAQAETPADQDRETSVQTVTAVLASADSQCLVDGAKRQKVTLSVLLQAAWSLFTCYQQNKDTAVFGTIVSGRANALTDIDKIVGLFINTVPVRVDCLSTQTIGDWLQGIHQASAPREEFGYLPLSDIKQTLNIPADKDLFRQLLVINNYPTSGNMGIDLAQVGLDIHDVESIEETNYELLMQGIYTQDTQQLTLYWRYNIAHFSALQVDHFAQVFNQLLPFLTENTERSVGDAMHQIHQQMQQLKQQSKTAPKEKRRRRRSSRSTSAEAPATNEE